MTGGSEEEAIVFFFQIGSLLQLRLDLDHERMFRVVEDRVIASGQEGRRERHIVESARTGFGRQIHFESCGAQHFVRMQSLYEEHACLVAAGIDGAIEAGNRNKCLSEKFIRHHFLLLVLLSAIGNCVLQIPCQPREPCRARRYGATPGGILRPRTPHAATICRHLSPPVVTICRGGPWSRSALRLYTCTTSSRTSAAPGMLVSVAWKWKTALDSPHDIVPWSTAPAVSGSTHRAAGRAVVALFAGG